MAGVLERNCVKDTKKSAEDRLCNRSRQVLTIALLVTYFAGGLIRGQDGVVFLDLLTIIEENMDKGSLIFLLGSLGFMIGCLVGGLLFDRLDKEMVYFFSVLFSGMICFVIPFSRSLLLMGLATLLRSLFTGAFISGGTFICVCIWGKGANPYVQALHSSFAVGCVVIPLITEPFLLSNTSEFHDGNITMRNMSPNITLLKGLTDYCCHVVPPTTDRTNTTVVSESPQSEATKVYMSFVITGVITSLSACFFLVVLAKMKVKTTSIESHRCEVTAPQRRRAISVVLYILTGILFASYGCIEKGIGSYVMSFAVTYLRWTKTDGANLTSCFYGAFAGSRIFRIYNAKVLTEFKMLIMDFLVLFIGLIVLTFAPKNSVITMWMSIGLCGAASAGVFPTTAAWINSHVTPVTGLLSAFFSLSLSLGAMMHLSLLGYLFERHSQLWFIYLTFGQSVVCFLSFSGIVLVNRGTDLTWHKKGKMEMYDIE